MVKNSIVVNQEEVRFIITDFKNELNLYLIRGRSKSI